MIDLCTYTPYTYCVQDTACPAYLDYTCLALVACADQVWWIGDRADGRRPFPDHGRLNKHACIVVPHQHHKETFFDDI